MDYFEVNLVGKESVKSVNATFLATLIRDLVKKNETNEKHCKYLMRCKEKLEITPRKKKKIREDEGFESEEDDDRSLISNEDAQSTSSSCFLVDDHVFKAEEMFNEKKVPERTPSSVGSTDSANSSGSSDTDEIETHTSKPQPVQREDSTELKKEYNVSDVIFCHTDSRFPTVIAWVVKKSNVEFGTEYRLGKSGVESIKNSDKCLEVIVVKCKTSENLKELCLNYKEYSKRLKLDQYKNQNRKTEDKKVSLADIKVTNSSLLKPSELSILQPKLISSFKSSSLLNVTNKTLNNRDQEPSLAGHHTKLSNSVSLNSLFNEKQELSQYETCKKELNITKTQSLSNISGRLVKQIAKTNMDFNLIQRTDLNGVTHIEISRECRDMPNVAKSKIRKEIEGVILTDVDSFVKKETVRQRQGHIGEGTENEVPPIRPERRRYVRKNKAPELPENIKEEERSRSRFYINEEPAKREQKVIKGQFVRAESNPWAPQPVATIGSWKGEDTKRVDVRRRSKSVDRLKILPKKAPMAYRYIDVTDNATSNPNSNKFFGLPQKIRQISGGRARRNSFDDTAADIKSNTNLKSVIKKNKKVNSGEPKKVTFSAFATVQVVD